MMQQLAIQIGSDFLDLFPDTKLEIEEQNPFLQFGTDVTGPFSLPFEVPHTENNVRMLRLVSYLPAMKLDVSLSATVWENGIQHSTGTLKIESIKGNINDLRNGSTSLFYLTGSSTFYDRVGKLKVNELEFGGDRTFKAVFNVQSGYTEEPGTFGEFLKTVLASDHTTQDFAFFPVLNDAISDDSGETAGMVNNIRYVGGPNGVKMNLWNYNMTGHNPIIPFPYLRYVIKKIFENVGWTIDGKILDDPDFKKICLLAYRDIFWCSRSYANSDHTQIFLNARYPTVTFNLKNFMPSNTVSEFLIALKDRFGWWYDFDLHGQRCTIRYLRDLVTAGGEDVTDIVETMYQNKLDTKGKVFSLTQNFDGQDSSLSNNDFETLDYLGEFLDTPGLPAVAENVGKYYLKIKDNAFFICRSTENNLDVYAWEKYCDNNQNYIPSDKTDTILTTANTVAQELIRLNNHPTIYPNHHGLFPRSDVSAIWSQRNTIQIEWPIRLIFYHGIHNDLNGVPYPYASNHPVDNFGNRIGNWCLSYKSKDIVTGEENGMYNLYWESFLKTLKQNETLTVKIRFPFSQKNALDFGDPKMILYCKYFLKSKRSFIPYDGFLELDLIRV